MDHLLSAFGLLNMSLLKVTTSSAFTVLKPVSTAVHRNNPQLAHIFPCLPYPIIILILLPRIKKRL